MGKKVNKGEGYSHHVIVLFLFKALQFSFPIIYPFSVSIAHETLNTHLLKLKMKVTIKIL